MGGRWTDDDDTHERHTDTNTGSTQVRHSTKRKWGWTAARREKEKKEKRARNTKERRKWPSTSPPRAERKKKENRFDVFFLSFFSSPRRLDGNTAPPRRRRRPANSSTADSDHMPADLFGVLRASHERRSRSEPADRVPGISVARMPVLDPAVVKDSYRFGEALGQETQTIEFKGTRSRCRE